MKLGLSIGYWGAGPPAGVPEMVAAAERLGFDSMWTAEAYGSDALTPLAWWGAGTSRIRLGTVDHAAVGADADGDRDGGDDAWTT